MSLEALVARARGLTTRRLPAVSGPPAALEHVVLERQVEDLAILRRWGGRAIEVLELDEDRRTLRAIARGTIANTRAARRVIGAVPTATLPSPVLARLAEATSLADLRALLEGHPLRAAFDADELFEIECSLARVFVEHARTRDAALRTYISQLVDIENAQAALAVSARGAGLDPEALFVTGGKRLDRRTFVEAAGSIETAREHLSRAFAKTPLARALFAALPSAIEDAGLAWQLATQTRLRRVEPLGLAPIVWLVLRRREEARTARSSAWSAALGSSS